MAQGEGQQQQHEEQHEEQEHVDAESMGGGGGGGGGFDEGDDNISLMQQQQQFDTMAGMQMEGGMLMEEAAMTGDPIAAMAGLDMAAAGGAMDMF